MRAFHPFRRSFSLSTLLIVLSARGAFSQRPDVGVQQDALKQYLAQNDSSFSWKMLDRKQIEGLTAFRLHCISQTWRDSKWEHQMLVVRPAEARNPDIGFLLISGAGSVDKSFELLRTLPV